MNVEDYYVQGRRSWVRLHEKGGKQHDMPAHHLLETYVDEYLTEAGIASDKDTPLFRTAAGKTGKLTDRRMTPHRRAAHDLAPCACGRHRDRARLPLVPGDRDHGLSAERRAARARAADGGEAELDDDLIDQGLRLIRQLWDAGIAHRDIKPANLMVRDGPLLVIDVFFVQVRPSPVASGRRPGEHAAGAGAANRSRSRVPAGACRLPPGRAVRGGIGLARRGEPDASCGSS